MRTYLIVFVVSRYQSNLHINKIGEIATVLLWNSNCIMTCFSENFCWNHAQQIAPTKIVFALQKLLQYFEALSIYPFLCRDLSNTAITTLPKAGLETLEILRIENTPSLKYIPSTYYMQVGKIHFNSPNDLKLPCLSLSSKTFNTILTVSVITTDGFIFFRRI